MIAAFTERRISAMDTLEFQRLAAELDCQIVVIKRKEDQRKRREDLQQRLKLVEHWIEGLQARVDAITKAGAVPVVDVGAKLEELRAEQASISNRLALKPELWPEGRKELEELSALMEAERFVGLNDEERWLTCETWACRWRLVIEQLEEEVVEHEHLARRCFAMIRDAMKAEPRLLWYIKALDKNEVLYDSKARLDECRASLAEIAVVRKIAAEAQADEARKEKEREEAQDAAVWNLMAAVREFTEAKETQRSEAERKLRHCLRQAARFEHLREEAGELARRHRNTLEPEFSFLWPKETQTEEAVPAKKMTMREIVARLLRRMKAKTLIGACHGPFERVGKGFPEHDKGRAKEALEAMSKHGVIRCRSTLIGLRVSIEPKQIPAVESFLEGKPLGIEEADAWIRSAEVR